MIARPGLRLDLRRHALLRVDPSSWPRVLERAGAQAVLAQWAVQGWPLIVRRYLPDETRQVIPVAAPLPPLPTPPAPSTRRQGLSLQLFDGEVREVMDAVELPAALAAAPVAWRPVMRTLASLGEECGSAPLLYGSLLWQLLTGMPYVTARSDLDLSWRVHSLPQAQSLIAGLVRIERTSPMRLDGELVLPDGGSIAWREYADAPADGDELQDELLVKTLQGVCARPRASLFGQTA